MTLRLYTSLAMLLCGFAQSLEAQCTAQQVRGCSQNCGPIADVGQQRYTACVNQCLAACNAPKPTPAPRPTPAPLPTPVPRPVPTPIQTLQNPVWGFADLHTHPATFLAFGADPSGTSGLLWGKPGLELSFSSQPSAIAADMPACAPDTHSGYDGDPVRHATHQQIIQTIDALTGFPHGSNGNPDYKDWPAALSIDHQAMHITEIRRAYEGGLRLLFASTTDNQLISSLWHIGYNTSGNPIPTPDPDFDLNSAIRQITFIRQLAAANYTWMQIVTSSAQARQAISSNKLAIVLSLEMDSLYPDQILNLIQNYGVRHVIPVHLSNNVMGGTAAFDDTFNANTYFLTGGFFSVHPNACVNFWLGVPNHLIHGPMGAIEPQPIDAGWFATLGYNTPRREGGQENTLGLNKSQFRRLMATGVLLDVAHMDEQSAADAISLSEQYHFPLMDSHTGIRDDSNCSAGVPPNTNERSIPYSQVRRLAAQGGVIGLGTATNTGPDPVVLWLHQYKTARALMGGKGVALGTDFNGLSPMINLNINNLPTGYPVDIGLRLSPPPGITVSRLQRFQLLNRTFDFAKDGIANYGLLPDFLQTVSERPAPSWTACGPACQSCIQSNCTRSTSGAGVTACVSLCKSRNPGPPPTPNPDAMPELAALFHSAEDVIQMWQKAETAAPRVPAPEGVQCSVFNDGYANMAGPSDAVFINGVQACVPQNNGTCRKWFGRCTTTVTHSPVYFSTFDDGAANLAGRSDAVFVNGGLQACIPQNNGTCRKWFGRGITQDGRTVVCNLFGDGYSDTIGPTDSIFPSSIQHGTQLCLPNTSTQGACRKWFGRCTVQ